jgi:hypothetical protein
MRARNRVRGDSVVDRIVETYGIGLGVLILGSLLHFETARIALPFYGGLGLAAAGLAATVNPPAACAFLARRQPLAWAAPALQAPAARAWTAVFGVVLFALGVLAMWTASNGGFAAR